MKTNIMTKTYSKAMSIESYEDRFLYLKLYGSIGEETFGFERYLNQKFYTSYEWRKNIRPKVLIRDNGFDMGHPDYPIVGKIIIHHINPITADDIKEISKIGFESPVFSLENLICVSQNTHNAIHYGDIKLLPKEPITRFKNDMCPWKRRG